jgi:hypothetical protein
MYRACLGEQAQPLPTQPAKRGAQRECPIRNILLTEQLRAPVP